MAIYPKILSLCTGLGGLDIGVEIVMPDARVVCAVERDAYCAAILAQSMEQGRIPQAPIWDDLLTFKGEPWRGAVDCVTAGYPCQPFSVAGQKRGAADSRHLWPEVFRVIGECEAPLVFLENVARHLSAGFYSVSYDLQSLGYTVAALVCRAATVGAPHQRERLFALAVSNAGRERIRELAEWMQGRTAEWERAELAHLGEEMGNTNGIERNQGSCLWQSTGSGSDQSIEDLANGNGNGFQGERSKVFAREQRSSGSELDRCSMPIWPPGPNDLERWSTIPVELWPSVESPIRGMAHGIPDGLGFRREQLHALGNAVVPLQAAYAFVTLVKAFTGVVENGF